MKKAVLTLIVILLLMTACQSAQTQENPEEQTGTKVQERQQINEESKELLFAAPEYPPYYGSDLPSKGFIAQIITKAFESQGYTITIEFVPWSRAVDETKAGNYHGLFTMWYREDRAEFFTFSDALPQNRLYLLTTQGKDITFTSYEDLKPYTIGTVRDYSYPNDFINANLTTEDVAIDEKNIEKLFLDRVDIVAIDRAQGEFILNEKFSDKKDTVKWLEPSIENIDQYIVASKAISTNQKIIDDFNKGLQEIKETKEYDQILTEFGFEYYIESE